MTPAAVIALAVASLNPPPAGGGPVAPPRLPAAEVADRAVRADDPAAPVGVVGVVVGGWGDRTLYVQDSSGGVTVALAAPAELPPVGAWVEAVGRPVADGGAGRLEGATVRRAAAAGPDPEPAPIPPGPAADPRLVARLVRAEGRVVGVAAVPGAVRLTVAGRAGGRVDAYLETGPGHPDPPAVPVGARVAVVGVYTRGGLGGGGDEVLLRSATDVEVRAAGFPADGGGWYSAAGLVALVAAGAGWVAVLSRRVRRQAAEAGRQAAERRRLEDQLRQAARLEAVGRLAAGVAHDFNNLLAVITGCAELLKGEVRSGSPAAGLADDIRDAGAYATALTAQLLAFGRPQPVAPHPLDLNGVVRDTARLLNRVMGGRVAVRQDLAPGLRPALAEPGLIGQILFNLAVNARDAMPAGGTLTIATGPGRAPGPGRPGGWVRLAVADTGEGMPPDVQARVFEPYFTTKPAGKGTGLGLAVVYGIVQSLGGRVWFTSDLGRGTRFEVELPAAEAPLPGVDGPTPPPALTPAPPRPADRGWPVVLLVEDDDGVRALARRLLEMRGLGVLAAGHPADALGLLASAGRVDVLLTDLLLPEMTGRELADRVRAARPGVRVVYMSGSPLADDLVPAAGFVLKPFAPADLSAAVDAALAGAVVPDPH